MITIAMPIKTSFKNSSPPSPLCGVCPLGTLTFLHQISGDTKAISYHSFNSGASYTEIRVFCQVNGTIYTGTPEKQIPCDPFPLGHQVAPFPQFFLNVGLFESTHFDVSNLCFLHDHTAFF